MKKNLDTIHTSKEYIERAEQISRRRVRTPVSIMKFDLIEKINKVRALSASKIKKMVLEENRFDILCTAVLHTDEKPIIFEPIHYAMAKFRMERKRSLIIAWRGAGKTTIMTICYSIFRYLLKNDICILLCSRSENTPKNFLTEIKGHFTSNPRFLEIFGQCQGDKWDVRSVNLVGHNPLRKENTFNCLGIKGNIVGRHWDLILADDLIDGKNSETEEMRGEVKRFWYSTIRPACKQPSGEVHFLGTRWHNDDLYNHFEEHDPEFLKNVQIVGVLNNKDISRSPLRFPSDKMHDLRRSMGIVYFDSQMMGRTGAMKGEIYQYAWFKRAQLVTTDGVKNFTFNDRENIPVEDFMIYEGVDLQSSLEEKGTAAKRRKMSKFAIIVMAYHAKSNIRILLDYWEGIPTYLGQSKLIMRYYEKWEVDKCFIEANGYQFMKVREFSESEDPEKNRLNVFPVYTSSNKIQRAKKNSTDFERGFIYYNESNPKMISVVSKFISFPREGKDIVDAYGNIMDGLTKRFKIRQREKEPGVF